MKYIKYTFLKGIYLVTWNLELEQGAQEQGAYKHYNRHQHSLML
jgi:hypothetical protein